MIHVIATIEVNPGCRERCLQILKSNVPAVLAEKGCHRYEPALDVASGMPAQGAPRAEVIILLETWDDLAALQAHLQTPHMAAYREKVKGLVKHVGLQIMAPA